MNRDISHLHAEEEVRHEKIEEGPKEVSGSASYTSPCTRELEEDVEVELLREENQCE